MIASDSIEGNVHRCQVHHDSIMNTSDHISVALDLAIDNVIITGSIAHDFPDRITWNKLTPEQIHNQYTLPLDDRLTQLVIRYGILNDIVGRHLSTEELISLLSEIARDILKESEENLLIIKYKSHHNPYWTPELTRLSKKDKILMKEWKAVCSPRNDDSDIWRR